MARPEKLPPSPISSHGRYWQGIWHDWDISPKNLGIEQRRRRKGSSVLEPNMVSFSAFVTRRTQPSLEEMARDESRPQSMSRKVPRKA